MEEEEGMVGHKKTLMEGTTLEHCTTQRCQQSNMASRAKYGTRRIKAQKERKG